jgi:MoaA/NifB/PqqE/SkfB family radical SAM enzyme
MQSFLFSEKVLMMMPKQFAAFYYNVTYAANIRKPVLLYKLLWRTMRSKLLRVPNLRYVDLCVSTSCNLACEHCFSENFKNRSSAELSWRKEELSLDEWKGVISRCKKAGALSFGITGGEPLLYKGLADLIRIIDPFDTYITINSNGILFDEKKAKELRALGVDAMLFSLDSADAAFHDGFRRMESAFEKTLHAVRLALRYGFKVCVVCTVSHENCKSKGVVSLIELTRRLGTMLIISRAAPVGRWRGRMDILLTKDDQEYIYSLVSEYPHVRTDFETNILKFGCSAGAEKLYITPYGDVLPCPFMHISFGNVLKAPLETIRESMMRQLGVYAPTCFVAENLDFIHKRLSKTFEKPCIIEASECFQ